SSSTPMASYLYSWFTSPTPAQQPTVDVAVIPPDEDADDDGTHTERGSDDDSPPAFPALNSAQRLQSSVPPKIPSILDPNLDSKQMPPPPLPQLVNRAPGVPSSRFGAGTPTAGLLSASPSTLAPPPTTTKPPPKPSKRREKVALAPGFGPLD